ncbi:MAG: 6-phospho-beta-glucosidase [Actinomycetota bacterium]|nr:6-phospho-beta-glucosidase [Actinomycetota bacterium]
MKIAVVGGGSTYTPELVSGIAGQRERLPVDELALMDIDEVRRDVVGGLAERMLRKQDWDGRLTVTDSSDEALDGADAVLLQLRVGGQHARLHDETAPLACGCIGQETTGAGGFAKAMRTVPVVLDIAERVRKRAAPDAWIIDFTNPVGIVTRALLEDGHRAVGLCNVAIGLQRSIAKLLGTEPSRVALEQVGLNHLTWVRAVRVDGRDVLPDLLRLHAAALAAQLQLPEALLHELGALPSYYLRYFYAHAQVFREQQTEEPRAAAVARIEAELLQMYRDPALTEKPALLEQRGGAFYSEAAVDLLTSLVTGSGDVQVVDVRNDGALAGLADDDVVEVPARIDRDGAHPFAQLPLDPVMLGLVQHVAAYERLSVKAARSRAPSDVRRALLAHPLVGQWDMAVSLPELLGVELLGATPEPGS